MSKKTHDILEEHFDTAFAAPDGIKKLRELILSLAMKGELVEQDSNDPPVSELLNKVEAEKERLLKDGKIKKSKPLQPIKSIEIPYALPSGWEWVRLGNIGQINPRNQIHDEVDAGFVPMPLIFSEYGKQHQYEKRKWSEIKKGYTHFANQDVGLAKITPCFENGKSCILSGLPNGVGAGTTELHIFRNSFGAILPKYLLAYFKNPRYINSGIPEMTGSAGQKRISKDFFAQHPFPLPPLSEQHRIVAKIDQLMARCDELEKLRGEREEKRLAIHSAAMTQLLDAQTSDSFTDDWDFIIQHFSELYSVKENVAELRKVILQLAVMGKLVPQNPDDPPASELLKEVRSEKRHLGKEGNVKKRKLLPPIKSGEVPGRLPQGWEWVRLDEILVFGPTNGFSPRAVDYETPVRSLTLSATTSGVFKGEHSKFLANDIPKDSDLWLNDGDILVQRGNTLEYVGVPAVYSGESHRYIYPDLMMKIRAASSIDVNYLHYAMSSDFCRDYLRLRASGTSSTMPKINQMTLRSLPIPLPPPREQHRIVAKIDQLINLCEVIEKGIDESTTKQVELLNAVMAQI